MAVTDESEKSNDNKGYCSPCCFQRKARSSSDVEDEVLLIEAHQDAKFAECADTSTLLYSGDVSPPLCPGDVVTVQGHIDKSCERFSINLLSLPEKNISGEERDVALHLNPRMSQRYVVRNSKSAGVWGVEETAAPTKFPLARDEIFTVNICIADDSFFVQINGIHFCQYSYRVAISRVIAIEVRGSGVQRVEVLRGHAPSYPSGKGAPPMAALESTDKINAWENPCTCILPSGLPRGKQVVICGRIKILPHSISINLQSSIHLWPHPDIPLHFNPRFMQSSKQQIIWNTWKNGWGKELRTETSQLVPSGTFQLRFQREDEQFSVWEKENLIGVFSFRSSPDDIKAVYVYGDVTIYDIYVQDAPVPAGSFHDDFTDLGHV